MHNKTLSKICSAVREKSSIDSSGKLKRSSLSRGHLVCMYNSLHDFLLTVVDSSMMIESIWLSFKISLQSQDRICLTIQSIILVALNLE